MLGLIWAESANGVIGRRGTIPWRLPEEQQLFKQVTMGATVVMGRATWESLPASVRPLPGRRNIVLTRTPGYAAPGAEVQPSLQAALGGSAAGGDTWVIGGAAVYAEALPLADRVVRTVVDVRIDDGDVVAPALGVGWLPVARDPVAGWHESSGGLRYAVTTYERVAGTV